jgi:DNA-binding NarL/FixJ family response regulator
MVREGLHEVISFEPDMEVVAEAGTGPQVIAAVNASHPDIVILDVEMPQHDVSATLGQIRRISPRTKVIVLTMHDEHYLVRDLLSRGAHAFLVKTVSRQELVSTIRTVMGDEERVVLAVSRESLHRMSDPEASRLSARELEVLDLVAQALSNAQIAHRLSITEGTVKRHLRNIFLKMGAVSRLDAVNKAVADGYLRQPR